MVTDNERREVAQRLRKLDYADLQESLICAYLEVLRIKGYEDWVGIARRLADLIDPPNGFDLDTVQRVCFECMEGCDEPEWSLYTTIYDAIVRYKREKGWLPHNLYSLYEAVLRRHPRNEFTIGDDEVNELVDTLLDICNVPGHELIQRPEPITGDTSDGYHTFDELYDHRAKLFSVIVRDHRELAWKSRLHHDGTMYDGMFIVGVETPQGQATYHYDIDPYWDLFDCKELDRAPEWDGHTPHQAIDRIAALEPSCDRDALLALADEMTVEKGDIWRWSSRIREALGEVDDGQE